MKYSLYHQIEEVEREIALRHSFYPRQVKQGGMRPSVAEFHIARMEAVLKTLQWFLANEDRIRKVVQDEQESTQ